MVAADPLPALLRDHRVLCERAVDPLEIAAGLEARGVTDRTAARFRHRDVFSLAEELYARATPRTAVQDRPPAPGPEAGRARCAAELLLALLPAALCATGLRAGAGRTALAAATLAALWLVLFRRSPLGVAGPFALPPLAYALAGDEVLGELLAGRPQPHEHAAAAAVLTLAFAAVPALWCRAWFAGRCRRRLAVSRGVRGFAAGARGLLAAAFGLYLVGLLAVLGLVRLLLGPFHAGAAAALGLLLGAVVLLVGHGFRRAAAVGLAAAGAAEALVLALVSASWLPGCDVLARPVAALADAYGVAAVPALVCGAVAAGLFVHAAHVLTGPAAHR